MYAGPLGMQLGIGLSGAVWSNMAEAWGLHTGWRALVSCSKGRWVLALWEEVWALLQGKEFCVLLNMLLKRIELFFWWVHKASKNASRGV